MPIVTGRPLLSLIDPCKVETNAGQNDFQCQVEVTNSGTKIRSQQGAVEGSLFSDVVCQRARLSSLFMNCCINSMHWSRKAALFRT
jgi:hypothetical protein